MSDDAKRYAIEMSDPLFEVDGNLSMHINEPREIVLAADHDRVVADRDAAYDELVKFNRFLDEKIAAQAREIADLKLAKVDWKTLADQQARNLATARSQAAKLTAALESLAAIVDDALLLDDNLNDSWTTLRGGVIAAQAALDNSRSTAQPKAGQP